jgi:transcriptional regulator NrdR family protein
MAKERCPYCSSSKVVWRGYRYNEKSSKRLRLCRGCGRKFTARDRFWRMRFSQEEIMDAVSLYRKGYSSSEVVTHMKRKGVKVSRWTVICWSRRFS